MPQFRNNRTSKSHSSKSDSSTKMETIVSPIKMSNHVSSSRVSPSTSSPKNNTTRKKLTKKIKGTAISWLLHSIKILLGDESIRRYIIIKYNPDLKNKQLLDLLETIFFSPPKGLVSFQLSPKF